MKTHTHTRTHKPSTNQRHFNRCTQYTGVIVRIRIDVGRHRRKENNTQTHAYENIGVLLRDASASCVVYARVYVWQDVCITTCTCVYTSDGVRVHHKHVGVCMYHSLNIIRSLCHRFWQTAPNVYAKCQRLKARVEYRLFWTWSLLCFDLDSTSVMTECKCRTRTTVTITVISNIRTWMKFVNIINLRLLRQNWHSQTRQYKFPTYVQPQQFEMKCHEPLGGDMNCSLPVTLSNHQNSDVCVTLFLIENFRCCRRHRHTVYYYCQSIISSLILFKISILPRSTWIHTMDLCFYDCLNFFLTICSSLITQTL